MNTTFFQEIRHAFRMLARSPGFTAVAALSLALGIGANSAMFSLHDAMMWRPLPVPNPGAVVSVTADSPDDRAFFAGRVSYLNYRDLRAHTQSFEGLIAYQPAVVSFARARGDVRGLRLGSFVSENFFDTLRVQPVLGRGFTPEEGQAPGRDAVVVLGHDFWTRALGADPSIVGQVIVVNGLDFTVIGVAPERFTGMDAYLRPALYIPLMMAERLSVGVGEGPGGSRANPLEDRAARRFVVKGRLARGVSQRAAQADLATLMSGLVRQYPDANRNRALAVSTELQARMRSDAANASIIVMMTTLAVLLLVIACANVANLMLGRARGRAREIAIRLALGVSRMRLLRQLLIESLTLASIGCALGLVFAYGGILFLAASIQRISQSDLPFEITPQLDYRVVGFSLLATVASAVLFGLWPAWQSLKTDLIPALKNADPGRMARSRTIGRNLLVGAQVALSMVLLVATGMLLSGFGAWVVLNPGFRTDHLIAISTDTAFGRYTPAQTRAFFRDVADRARALPGVASVALASSVPFDGNGSREAVIPEGYTFPRGLDRESVSAAFVDEHYFDAMKTAIVRGRAFTADDREGTQRVAIINDAFATRYWPGQDPIGKRLRLNDTQGPWVEVVGLTRTGKYGFVGEPPTPFLFEPFAQNVKTQMSLVVETTSPDATSLAGPLREVVRAVDVNQPVFNVRTLSSLYEQRAIGPPLMVTRVTSALGVLGLSLALIGLYGLVAYSVARRTREIGLRIAMGAARSQVMGMVLRQGLTLSIAGVAVGGVLSLAVARMLMSAMSGLGAPSPATYVLVPFMLVGLTLLASYVPARRAAAVDPLRALRDE